MMPLGSALEESWIAHPLKILAQKANREWLEREATELPRTGRSVVPEWKRATGRLKAKLRRLVAISDVQEGNAGARQSEALMMWRPSGKWHRQCVRFDICWHNQPEDLMKESRTLYTIKCWSKLWLWSKWVNPPRLFQHARTRSEAMTWLSNQCDCP